MKCLPLISIIFFHLHDIKFNPRIPPVSYSDWILTGEVCGVFGDLFLCLSPSFLDSYFIAGFVSFSLGHCSYITAFGFKVDDTEALILFAIPLILILRKLFKLYLDINSRVMIATYTLLVVTMAWRAMAKSQVLHGHYRELDRLALMFGGLLFTFSDYLLILRSNCPLNDCYMWLMASYYAAQYCIWSSATNWYTLVVKP